MSVTREGIENRSRTVLLRAVHQLKNKESAISSPDDTRTKVLDVRRTTWRRPAQSRRSGREVGHVVGSSKGTL